MSLSNKEHDVIAHLERLIFSGELPPGAKLREAIMAEKLQVGRGPLREAIRILEGRRLLVRTPNAGVSVISPTIDDFEQLLVTREALEGMAARYAAENMTSSEIKELRQVADLMQKIDTQSTAELSVFDNGPDSDFHRKIALGSRNRWITQLLCDDLYSLLKLLRFKAAALRPNPTRSHIEHSAIIDCIQRRDANGAESLMRDHVCRSRERLLISLRS